MFKELGAMMSLLGNKGKIQDQVQKFQQETSALTAEASSGGGLVMVKVNGRLEVVACKIAEDALRLNDREVLEDLIVAATNQALSKVREQIALKTAEMAAALGLPPHMLGNLGGLPGT